MIMNVNIRLWVFDEQKKGYIVLLLAGTSFRGTLDAPQCLRTISSSVELSVCSCMCECFCWLHWSHPLCHPIQAASGLYSAKPCGTGRNTPVWPLLRGRRRRAILSSPTDHVGESVGFFLAPTWIKRTMAILCWAFVIWRSLIST